MTHGLESLELLQRQGKAGEKIKYRVDLVGIRRFHG